MNLKESFRYQTFLGNLMRNASSSIMAKDHCLTTEKEHLRSQSDPDALDITETVVSEEHFYPNDTVIAFLEWLVAERSRLSEAIGRAKSKVGFDIDAAIETNKFRQNIASSIQEMLRRKPTTKKENGIGYKFNAEGNQVEYHYDVIVSTQPNYNTEVAKSVMRCMITEADKTSSEIDAALVNTEVDYTPVYDVNESFDDVMAMFEVQNS
ncbi:MAG: hypothetical protein LUD69_05860 [Oscillospiraceae bacterium]|nr:hypothetical protein [Oscillospiraceae bacterium]